jgi:hypothetical protein
MNAPRPPVWLSSATVACSVAALLISALSLSQCTPGQREGARTALDITQTLCVIANQVLPDTSIAQICGIAGPLIDPMKDILASARTASARAASAARTEARTSGACSGSDAGPP